MFKKILDILGSNSKMSSNLRQLYDSAGQNLEDFRRTFETIANEVDFVPEESRPGAIRLIDNAKNDLSEFEEEWSDICQQQPTSEDILRALIKQIALAKERISILEQRRICRRQLRILEKRLALRQSALTKDELNQVASKEQAVQDIDEELTRFSFYLLLQGDFE